MAANILLVFEGAKKEFSYLPVINKYIKSSKIAVSYGSCLYSLYNVLSRDENIDIFTILTDYDQTLKKYKRDDFSEIYLFFDYDSHDRFYDYDNVSKMLDMFNNETEQGKLFISYPMIESLIDMENCDDLNSFLTKKVSCLIGSTYKSIVANSNDRKLKNSVNNFTDSLLNQLVRFHCTKANFIVNNTVDFPSDLIDQKTILDIQHAISECNTLDIFVLNSFPLMLLHYLGIESLKKHLED